MMNKVLIYDIETLQEFFLVSVYDVEVGSYHEFQVNKNTNQLGKLIRFIDYYKDYYWVGYNNLRFDSQVIEWVYRNHEEWEELGALEVCAKIAQKAADVIHDANYEVLPEFSEFKLSTKQIRSVLFFIQTLSFFNFRELFSDFLSKHVK